MSNFFHQKTYFTFAGDLFTLYNQIMSYNSSHFAELIYSQAAKYGNRAELLCRNNNTGKWDAITWNTFAEKVRLTSQAMVEYGIGVHENIGIYAQNMQHCYYTGFGAFGIRAVEVPMYATSSPEQIRYIIRDANIRMLFVGEQLQYNNAFIVQKDNADTTLFQFTSVVYTIQRITRKSGNFFCNNQIYIALFSAGNHAIKCFSLFCACAGNAFVSENFD